MEVMKEKEPFRVESDSNEENLMLNEKEQRKKKPIRLWGINTEKIKRFWTQYLEGTESFSGLWICIRLLDFYLSKYIEKKKKSIRDEEVRMERELKKSK